MPRAISRTPCVVLSPPVFERLRKGSQGSFRRLKAGAKRSTPGVREGSKETLGSRAVGMPPTILPAQVGGWERASCGSL